MTGYWGWSLVPKLLQACFNKEHSWRLLQPPPPHADPDQALSRGHHVPDVYFNAWSTIQVPEYRPRTDPQRGLPSGAFPSELHKKSERALNGGERQGVREGRVSQGRTGGTWPVPRTIRASVSRLHVGTRDHLLTQELLLLATCQVPSCPCRIVSILYA